VRKITLTDRILLLGTCLLAAYQISVGIQGLSPLATWGFTTGFGTLLVSGLLLIILGFDGLERQGIVIVSTLIPLSISLGLVTIHIPDISIPYLFFCVIGFGLIGITRFSTNNKLATIILAFIHGIAGLLITFLPIIHGARGQTHPGYMLVGLGGAFIGVGGILLATLRTGKPLFPQNQILSLLPLVLFLMTLAFIGGFSFQ
jgi:hypothetical protein